MSRLFSQKSIILGAILLTGIACSKDAAAQTYFDDIGWTELHQMLGNAIPDGSGVNASLVEANDPPLINSSSIYYYEIDPFDSEFTGKTITNLTPDGGVSNHATTFVGNHFFGLTSSIAPGVTSITAYGANDWINNVLNAGLPIPPDAVTADVQNFSWVGSTLVENSDTQILQRFDASIFDSDFVAVVGLGNGSGGTIPALLASSYNSITVGLSNGNHSQGLTTINGVGRSKPDIVTPTGLTSTATAQVSSAAAVLIQTAGGSSSSGAHATVIKSALLAGATRENESEFTWTANRDNGVNSIRGAGELNILRSYNIIMSGEKNYGADLGASGSLGWDYDSASLSSTRTYFFQIPEGGLYDYGIVLSWMISGSTLVDLDLSFYNASGTTLGTLIAAGYDDSRDLSTTGDVNNLEMLAFGFLAEGSYAIRVNSGSFAPSNYGLAWGGTAVPEPSTILLFSMGLIGAFVLHLRRRLG